MAHPDREGVQAELSRYTALDVVVVRSLASATLEAMATLAEAAAPSTTA